MAEILTSRWTDTAALILALASVLSGCTEPDQSEQPDSATSKTSSPNPPRTPRSDVSPHHERITVDWGDAGVRWETIVRIPFGPDANQLGFAHHRGQDPIVPSALAVTPDGFAIMDPAKRRAVLVDTDGRIRQTWTGLAEQASDLVWDEESDRLVVIDHEADGRLAELHPDGTVTTAAGSPSPVFRLVTTAAGAVALGASDAELTTDLYHLVPDPIGPLTNPSRDLPIADGNHMLLEPRSRDARSWQVALPGQWELRLDYNGRNGPHRVVAPLREDPSLEGARLVLPTVAGSFDSDLPFTRRLLVTEVDRRVPWSGGV